MWVWRQKQPANAATGSIATSSQSTDHTPKANTTNQSIGR